MNKLGDLELSYHRYQHYWISIYSTKYSIWLFSAQLVRVDDYDVDDFARMF